MEVLLRDAVARASWRAFLALYPDARLEWTTQRGISWSGTRGILDLVLLAGDRPVLVVENKVGAVVRKHASGLPENGDATEGGNQLRTYGGWLGEERAATAWPGALVLLTHTARPPQDFETGDYGVPFRRVVRWSEVYAWFAARRRGAEPSGVNDVLATEFGGFLKMSGMAADHATRDDLAIVQASLDARRKLEATVEHASQRVERLRVELALPLVAANGPDLDEGASAFWSWCYLKGPNGKRLKWFLGWGFRFPREGIARFDRFAPPPPTAVHGLVGLFDETEGEGLSPEGALTSVGSPGLCIDPARGEIVAVRHLHDLPLHPDRMATAFAEWVEDATRGLVPAMKAIASRAK